MSTSDSDNPETLHATDLILPRPPEFIPAFRIDLLGTESKLYTFQVTAIDKMAYFLRTKPARAVYNACEQGLGKTLQTIVTLKHTAQPPILILCPAVLRLTWEDEINKWAPNHYTVFPCLASKDFERYTPESHDILILSYELAAKEHIYSKLIHQHWGAVVYDEAHYCNHLTAKRTRRCLGYWKHATYRVCLSGTPFTTSIVDAHTLFALMAPGMFGVKSDFGLKYCYPKSTGFGVRYQGGKNLTELSKAIRSHFFVRYTKEEVMPDMPPITYTKVVVDEKFKVVEEPFNTPKLDHEMHRLAQSYKHNTPERLYEDYGVLAQHRHAQVQKKIPFLYDWIVSLLVEGTFPTPLVIFGYHTGPLKTLSNMLSKFKPAVVMGEVPARKRKQEIDRFQAGNTQLFFGQYKAAGTGITLTRAHLALLIELDWSAAVVEQAVARLHRIGQQSAVTAYMFAVKNSIDDAVHNIVINNLKLFKRVTDTHPTE